MSDNEKNRNICIGNIMNKEKKEIQKFWGKLYDDAYGEFDKKTDQNKIKRDMEAIEKLFEKRAHLAVREMPLNKIKNKKVLEIGSGAGVHSALFATKGGDVCSIDITWNRVLATKRKFEMIVCNNNLAMQADAENLPFRDNYFDFVYSNGVLHHTFDTQKAIHEVRRVLKPDGKAVIMLYARDSLYYWFTLFLIRGVLMGNIFRRKRWLGRVTEWMSTNKQKVFNPETKVYSKREIMKLLKEFENIQIRKGSFVFQQIPVIGPILSKIAGKRTGINESGLLLYGMPWRNETKFELWTGRYIGFALNILAIK